MRIPPQTDYWDRVAHEKRFTHPLRMEWLTHHVISTHHVLDYGCGYGRTLEQLDHAGYTNAVGVDFSERMLLQCRSRFPHLKLVRSDGQRIPFRDQSFDAVLLFAVLTCIPDDDDQRALIAETLRVLRPDGLLYISDLLINSDLRNVERYQRHAEEYGVYGAFELPDGGIVRHHREEWIQQLTARFICLEFEHFTARTMNGNSSAAFQYLGRVSTL